MTFDEFNLDDHILKGIAAMGYKQPSPIQELAIPYILDGEDLIACAQTGTGKTAAFVLPVLHKIIQTAPGSINTLILVPTRELALQIDQQIEAMGYYVDVSSIAVYGGGSGSSWVQQKQALQKGADIIIATPGRLIAQLQMGGLDFSYLEHLVLDEADRMLDMGFYDDIIRIVATLPKNRQTICFSATMPDKMRTLCKQLMRNPKEVSIAISKPAEGIKQLAYLAYDKQKDALLLDLLQNQDYQSIILFSSTKEKTKHIEKFLHRKGVASKAFHSDLEQEERERILLAFRNRNLRILIGTDVLSRGIDVEGIDLVINYDVPPDPADYVHRVGRTARAATQGTAITFINEKDQQKFAAIEKLIERKVELLDLKKELGPAPENRIEEFKINKARPKKKYHKAPKHKNKKSS